RCRGRRPTWRKKEADQRTSHCEINCKTSTNVRLAICDINNYNCTPVLDIRAINYKMRKYFSGINVEHPTLQASSISLIYHDSFHNKSIKQILITKSFTSNKYFISLIHMIHSFSCDNFKQQPQSPRVNKSCSDLDARATKKGEQLTADVKTKTVPV
ncbi:hypothetical protein L9F63_027180, partial [Diploptera punctata]